MSATGRSDMRHADDFYATPAWCVRAILLHLEAPSSGTLDPCCGDGAILRVLETGRGIEIDNDRWSDARWSAHFVQRGDALAMPWGSPRQVITNPPYKLAMAFVLRALEECRGEVAMLLRLNWLASRARAAFHKAHPADVYVLPRRPSFTGGGSDATEYAWFVWGPGRGNRWSILDCPEGDR